MSTITILTALQSALLAKRLAKTPNGWDKASYDFAKTFDVETAEVTSIDDLSAFLTMVEDIPSSCIIRGRRKPGALTKGVQRRLHDAPDGKAAFEEQAVHWLMIDIDDLPADPNMTNEERLAHMVDQPPCFQDVTFHYQWSSGAGLDGWANLRAHLFFWLDRPIRCSDLRAQADAQGWAADLSLFNGVQIHYTAAPVFTNTVDPLLGFRSGLAHRASDAVTLPAWSPPKPIWTPEGRVYPPCASFQDRLDAIGPNYHLPILKAAACYVATHGSAADIYDLKTRLKDAIYGAPPGRNRKADYLNDRYLDRVINGAIRKFSNSRMTDQPKLSAFRKMGL